MKKQASSTKTLKAYEELVSAMAPRGAEASAMFGMPTVKVGGKAFAGLVGDALVFKLTGEDHRQALALPGAQLFDPSGRGRPMKEWVVVPAAHAKQWPVLAQTALAYAQNLKRKRTATK